MRRPIGIDLFACAGGLSLGFEQAGFDIVASVEIDPIHCAIHAFNFPRCKIIPKSIAELTGEEIRRCSGIGRKRVDVVFGGPPCQGFSLIGHRAMDDPRNSLVREFVRIVTELRPAYFVFENVKGLTLGHHRGFLDELIDAFDQAGYKTRLPWMVLDAADFGVPQHRERLILMGARRDAKLPEYPVSAFRPADRLVPRGVPKGPTCRDALGDLPDVDDFDALLHSDEVTIQRWGKLSKFAAEMRCKDASAWHLGYRRNWNKKLLTSSMRSSHSAISQRRFEATKQGEVEPISRFFKLPPDGLSNTLRAGTDSSRGAFTSPRPIHFQFSRCVTVREMARLHGFPDWFRFHVTKWHGARQIGNAVPPPLARAIASQIVLAIGKELQPPAHPIEMGDSALLRMDMSEAANHFGVSVPIGKRDKKSGLKKRKQHEIEAALTLSLPFEAAIAF